MERFLWWIINQLSAESYYKNKPVAWAESGLWGSLTIRKFHELFWFIRFHQIATRRGPKNVPVLWFCPCCLTVPPPYVATHLYPQTLLTLQISGHMSPPSLPLHEASPDSITTRSPALTCRCLPCEVTSLTSWLPPDSQFLKDKYQVHLISLIPSTEPCKKQSLNKHLPTLFSKTVCDAISPKTGCRKNL